MNLLDFDSVSGDRDLATVRKIVVNTGEKVTVRKDDVYGFWTLHLEKGQLPVQFRGQYTSYQMAKKDLAMYLSQKLKHIVDEEM